MENSGFRVAVIEHSEIICFGLIDILERDSRFNIAYSGATLPVNSDSTVRVVFINPSLSSISTIREIFPEARVVAILYNYFEQSILRHFDDSVELTDSTQRILEIAERNIIAIEERGSVVGDADELSEREREILVAVAKGMLNKEIADLYNISIHTVVAHRKNIQRKTGIRSVSGLVVYALLNNLITEVEILQ